MPQCLKYYRLEWKKIAHFSKSYSRTKYIDTRLSDSLFDFTSDAEKVTVIQLLMAGSLKSAENGWHTRTAKLSC
jgi:hypothetical protein